MGQGHQGVRRAAGVRISRRVCWDRGLPSFVEGSPQRLWAILKLNPAEFSVALLYMNHTLRCKLLGSVDRLPLGRFNRARPFSMGQLNGPPAVPVRLNKVLAMFSHCSTS